MPSRRSSTHNSIYYVGHLISESFESTLRHVVDHQTSENHLNTRIHQQASYDLIVNSADHILQVLLSFATFACIASAQPYDVGYCSYPNDLLSRSKRGVDSHICTSTWCCAIFDLLKIWGKNILLSACSMIGYSLHTPVAFQVVELQICTLRIKYHVLIELLDMINQIL